MPPSTSPHEALQIALPAELTVFDAALARAGEDEHRELQPRAKESVSP